MTGQAQAIDGRQGEIKSLSTELQILQEKCSFTEKELERKKSEIANLRFLLRSSDLVAEQRPNGSAVKAQSAINVHPY